jgi:hypothetical protein
MTGYTKTKTFTTGETILADHFTTEFNNISVAFDESTGHNHNGDVDSGAFVPLISSADTFTKITTTEATDQLNFYTKVSGAAALQLSFKDGVIEPNADSDVDIGTTAKRFKDLYVDSATVTGTVTADSLIVQTSSGNAAASVNSATGRAALQVVSTFDGEVADQEASIEIGAENLAHLDLKTPNSDDFDLRISHSEVSDLSMVNSLVDNLFLRSGGKVALQHGGAHTKLETTATGVDVTGTLSATNATIAGTASFEDQITITANTDTGSAQPTLTLRSNEGASIDNQLAEITFQGHNDQQVDQTYAYMRAESPVIIDNQEEGKLKFFVRKTGNAYANSLSVDSSGINVTGTVTADGVKLGDNEKIQIGNTQDLELFHDGTNSYVQDSGDGQLIVNTTNGGGVYVQSAGETMAQFISNGTVNLYHDNDHKFATTATGIDVTGNIAVSGTVDGRDIAADGILLDAIEAGADVTDTANVVAALTAGDNITIAANGTITATDTDTTYLTATSSTAGLVKIGYVENNKNYPVELSSDKMFVNVPWTDSQTAGTGLSLVGGEFSVNASQTQITSVGALGSGTITSGFGSINVGSDSINTTGFVNAGTVNFPSHENDTLKITSSIVDSTSHLQFWVSDNTDDTFKFMTSQYAVSGAVEAELMTLKATATGAGKALLTVDGQTNTLGLKLTSSQVVTSIDTDLTGVSAAHDTLPTALATKTYVDAVTAAASAGDITSVVAGDGLTGGATSGDATVNVVGGVGIVANADEVVLDLSELTTSEDNDDGDFFAVVDTDGAQKKLTKANIALSSMNNDSGWTSNAGTVTSVGAGTGLSTTGGTTPSLSVDAAQSGITSLGTLSALNVTGDLTLNGSYPTGTQNTFVGAASRSALTATALANVGVGSAALQALTTGDYNLAVGGSALFSLTSGSNNVAIGQSACAFSTTGSGNTAIGKLSLYAGVTVSSNTAIGGSALYALTAGNYNVAIGENAGRRLTAGTSNAYIGKNAGYNADEQSFAVAIGKDAGVGAVPDGATVNFTGGDNCIALGVNTLNSQTTGYSNTAIGTDALKDLTTSYSNVAIGGQALMDLTTGTVNTGIGTGAAESVTTGTATTALGQYACREVTSGNYNTAMGWRALSGFAATSLTGSSNLAVGKDALAKLSGASNNNTAIGTSAGNNLTSGNANFLAGLTSGGSLTTASNQTIIGGFNGNGSGLDLRTNTTPRLVLAAGSFPVVVSTATNFDIMVGPSSKAWSTINGGVRFFGTNGTSSLYWARPSTQTGNIDAARYYHNGQVIGEITTSTTGVAYNVTSDYRLKENVTPLTGSIDRLKALKPCTFNFLTEPSKNEEGFIAHEVQEVVPQAVSGTKDAVDENGDIETQGLDTSRLVPLLTSALQEAIEKIEQLEERISALEA